MSIKAIQRTWVLAVTAPLSLILKIRCNEEKDIHELEQW
jgi:hypothetical protein